MKNRKDRIITFSLPAGLTTDFEDRYMNIPVNLLQGIIDDPFNACQKIIFFCIYQHAYERLKHGTLGNRIELAGKFFQINTCYNAYIMTHGNYLYKDWLVNKSPRGGVKVRVFYDIATNQKSEFDKIVFCALVGLKSIIQKDQFKKTSFDALFARMAGFSSVERAAGNIPENILKYKSRHYRSKIIQALEDNWHLAYEADHTRGFYFSFKINHEALCMEIQKCKSRKKNIQIQKVKDKKETRVRVKQLFDHEESHLRAATIF